VRRLTGRLRADLAFGQIGEIMAGGLHAYLTRIQKEYAAMHTAIYEVYIAYPVEAALEA